MMTQREASSEGHVIWSFEYLRILAAFVIIFRHIGTPGLHHAGPFGLWVFLLISFMLLARSVPRQAVTAFAAAKARRVMVPWLFWSAFYLSFSLWRFWRHGTPFFEPWMLLTGFSLHLWYLPYLFGASVAVHLARRSGAALDRSPGILLTAALGVAILAADGMWHTYTPPVDQWSTAVPVTLLGYALGRITLIPECRPRRAASAALAACAAAVCVARFSFPGHYGSDAASVLVALATVMLAGPLPFPRFEAVRLLSSLTLGIYLLHPFVRDMLARVIGESASPLRAVLIFAASAAVVYGMRKVPVLRAVV